MQESDPIYDLSIGMSYIRDIRNLLKKLKNKYGGQISFRNYKKTDDPRFVGRWIKTTTKSYYRMGLQKEIFEVHYYKDKSLSNKNFWVGWESPAGIFVTGAECIDINDCEETIESMINR